MLLVIVITSHCGTEKWLPVVVKSETFKFESKVVSQPFPNVGKFVHPSIPKNYRTPEVGNIVLALSE